MNDEWIRTPLPIGAPRHGGVYPRLELRGQAEETFTPAWTGHWSGGLIEWDGNVEPGIQPPVHPDYILGNLTAEL